MLVPAIVEVLAPAMIISPGECATHPHMTGRVPHPSGDIK
jgi:hypothetical protein